MEEITIEILIDELQKWTSNHSNRDSQGVRFGQYIWLKYNLDPYFTERDAGFDGFNEQSPNKVFEIISTAITNNK